MQQLKHKTSRTHTCDCACTRAQMEMHTRHRAHHSTACNTEHTQNRVMTCSKFQPRQMILNERNEKMCICAKFQSQKMDGNVPGTPRVQNAQTAHKCIPKCTNWPDVCAQKQQIKIPRKQPSAKQTLCNAQTCHQYECAYKQTVHTTTKEFC